MERSASGNRSENQDDREEAGTLHRFVAEAVAVFIYVLLGAGVEASTRVIAYRQHRALDSADWLLSALAHGIALLLAIMVTKWISGAHANPAITLGLAAVRIFPWARVAPQLAAQFTGALVGAAAVLLVLGRSGATVGLLGAAQLGAGVGLARATLIEGAGTAILTLTVIATGPDPRAPLGWNALAIGMSVFAVTLVMGPATSALVNPARAFGPDLVDTLVGVPVDWLDFVVAYLAGSLLGSILVCWLYTRLSALPTPP